MRSTSPRRTPDPTTRPPAAKSNASTRPSSAGSPPTHRPPAATLDALQALLDQFVREYNQQRPHSSLGDRTPTAAYHTRPKATASTSHQTHYRVRRDRVSHGNISLRVNGVLHHIGVGRHLHGTPIIMLIVDLDVRVIHATTGEIIRTLTIDPTRRYHGTGAPIGGPQRPYGPKTRRTEP